ncbi:porin family protein [Niabella drilacis]|uniref:Outer membrane protein beta-barrel domain-containing protein n=1 Tax=Niabella drilacis (strain DSM 25811 / CCM 8410 / CCUG 62505 / LMG 26954 / E90) TaxID=1285928 RepID=A0A1G6RGQ7_NIADE|nr:porin family protein [Niabella drilacis]SDD03195.1 Outer membrane protein beta-barrel domain-containing protein [Niabella drilacis]
MKKYILIIIVISIAGFSRAQRNIEIAFKPGVSIPSLHAAGSDNPLSSGYRSQAYQDAALHAEYKFSRSFSIQPQLEYSLQGGRKNGLQAFPVPGEMAPLFPPGEAPAYLYADYTSETKLAYFLLPVLVKYHLNPQKKWDVYIAAGPFASYLLGAKNRTSGSSIIYPDENKTQPLDPQPRSFNNEDNIANDLHRFNTGITGHMGLGRKIISGSIFLEVGGNYGIIVIQKNSANGRNRTGAAVISLGYQYEL